MSQCSVCGNEKAFCICPKKIGGQSAKSENKSATQTVEAQREMPLAVRVNALEILREKFKPAEIAISSVDFLSEPARRNLLLRINLFSNSESVPTSVILKQVLPQGDAGDKQADARFARDWAGLEFSSRIQERSVIHCVPLFYGSDLKQRFILIEDLGKPHISLVDSLLNPDRDNAILALERYMKTLGSFHAATYGYSDEYEKVLKEIHADANTPAQDLVSRSEQLIRGINLSIKFLDLPLSEEEFSTEVQQIFESMFLAGPFTVLVHGDIAPDNTFDHEGTQGLQLIDFEACALRNALLDGTYLRMSIPTGWCAKAIPNDELKRFEHIYREELKKTIPAATNDLLYSTAYTYACAYHALDQLSNLQAILDHDEIWPAGPMPQYPLWDPTTNSKRSRFLSRVQAFLDVAADHDKSHPDQPPILPYLRKMAEDVMSHVKKQWGQDVKPLDFYPAFQQDSHQLDRVQNVYEDNDADDYTSRKFGF